MILIWPAGHFKRLPRGTTASQVVRDQVGQLTPLGFAQRGGGGGGLSYRRRGGQGTQYEGVRLPV